MFILLVKHHRVCNLQHKHSRWLPFVWNMYSDSDSGRQWYRNKCREDKVYDHVSSSELTTEPELQG